jgi:PAS domain S-box-containing protein
MIGEQKSRAEKRIGEERICWEIVEAVNSVILRWDTDLKVTFINRFAQEFFGFTSDEILGKSLLGTIVPATSTSGSDLSAMIRGIVRYPERYVNNENENMRHDGTRVWISWTNRALRDNQGNVREIISVGNDITDRKRVDEALERQLKMIESLLDAIPVPVFYKNVRGIYTGCNRAFATFIGKPKDEIIGKTVYEVAPPDLADIYHKADDELLHHPGKQVYETSVIAVDGARHDVVFNKAAYFDEAGTVAGIIGTILDITKRKNSERELVKAREELERRVLDRTRELEEANRLLRNEIVEHKRDEVALKKRVRFENLITSLSSSFINLAPEEMDRELYYALKKIGEFAGVDRCYIGIVYGDGKKLDIAYEWAARGIRQYPQYYHNLVANEVYPWSARIVRKFEVLYLPSVEELPPEAGKDKETLQSQEIKSLVVVPMVYKKSLIGIVGFDSVKVKKAWTDDDIALLRIVGEIFANALERKWIEEDLRESEERFRATFEQAAVGITHVALDGRYLRVNEKFCDIVECDCDEILSHTFQDMTYPGDIPAQEELTDRLLRGEIATYTLEKRYVRRDGSLVWANLTVSLVRGTDGTPKYFMGVVEDITRRKQSEEALNKAKSRAELYLDLMGHDISNMNQAMMGYLEMAQELLDLKGQEELIERPLEIIHHSSRLIASVKKLEKAQSGKYPLKIVDLGPVLKEVADAYATVPGRAIKIKYTPVEGYCVRANDLLKDVFDHLLDNAIRHSTGPLEVDLAVEAVAQDGRSCYRVSVTDNGPGIPDELKRKIFRLVDEATGSPGRRGLGLYMVRTLVESYNGRAWVEDRVPGDYHKGSRFVVLLPAAEPGGIQEERSGSPL